VIARLHANALAAEIAAGSAAEKAGGSLADILVAQVTGRLAQLIGSLEGSPHIEELFSEHLAQPRDLYQKYAELYDAHDIATIERVCRKQRLTLAKGMTPRGLARCIEMAINGTKSMHPAMQPATAFLADLEIMLRMLVAGAAAPSPKARAAKLALAKTSPRPKLHPKPGDRK